MISQRFLSIKALVPPSFIPPPSMTPVKFFTPFGRKETPCLSSDSGQCNDHLFIPPGVKILHHGLVGAFPFTTPSAVCQGFGPLCILVTTPNADTTEALVHAHVMGLSVLGVLPRAVLKLSSSSNRVLLIIWSNREIIRYRTKRDVHG